MKRFALIGHPVAGSLSPQLFAAAYGGRYAYDLLDYDRFADAWQAFLNGYEGINVTAPYKLDAYAAVDVLGASARETGAVNLVVRTPAGLEGHNADVDGIVGALTSFPAWTGNLPASSVALVVGTGGAARAAVAAARRLGCQVWVTGRSEQKAAALGCPFLPLDFRAGSPVQPHLVLYTLPSSAPVPEGLPLENAVVLEAEYKAPRLAGAPCRCYVSGRRWLLHQALAGYRLFTGEDPDAAAMSNVIQ